MADFCRSIRPRWTNFLTSISHTEVSLRSAFWHTPPFVVALWGYCTLWALLGKRSVFSESPAQAFYKWSMILFSVSRVPFSSYLRFLFTMGFSYILAILGQPHFWSLDPRIIKTLNRAIEARKIWCHERSPTGRPSSREMAPKAFPPTSPPALSTRIR